MNHFRGGAKAHEMPGFTGRNRDLERVMGIEPTCEAWKASVLPLNYTRMRPIVLAIPGMSMQPKESNDAPNQRFTG